jgi:hypothetical protein
MSGYQVQCFDSFYPDDKPKYWFLIKECRTKIGAYVSLFWNIKNRNEASVWRILYQNKVIFKLERHNEKLKV